MKLHRRLALPELGAISLAFVYLGAAVSIISEAVWKRLQKMNIYTGTFPCTAGTIIIISNSTRTTIVAIPYRTYIT